MTLYDVIGIAGPYSEQGYGVYQADAERGLYERGIS